MLHSKFRYLLPLLAVLLLAACGKDEGASSGQAANNDPASAIMNQVKLLKAGRIDDLVKASLPADDYQAVRRKFDEERSKQEPITDAQRKQFAEKMQKLTAPDAEQSLFNQLLPVLKQYDTKYKAQLPMYIGMGQTMMGTAINQSKDLTPEQKKQATEMMAAAAQWAQNTDWGDQAKAKQAIGVVTSTVRKLDIKTLDQARALDYDQAMQKYAQIWQGVRKVLAVYGVDVDAALDSVKASTISQKDHTAMVETRYTLFDKPMKSQIKMVEKNGHWYNQHLLEKVEKSLAEHEAASSSSTAAAASSMD